MFKKITLREIALQPTWHREGEIAPNNPVFSQADIVCNDVYILSLNMHGKLGIFSACHQASIKLRRAGTRPLTYCSTCSGKIFLPQSFINAMNFSSIDAITLERNFSFLTHPLQAQFLAVNLSAGLTTILEALQKSNRRKFMQDRQRKLTLMHRQTEFTKAVKHLLVAEDEKPLLWV